LYGSSEVATIRNTNASISPKHAKIFAYKGRFYVKDAGSKYGTYLFI